MVLKHLPLDNTVLNTLKMLLLDNKLQTIRVSSTILIDYLKYLILLKILQLLHYWLIRELGHASFMFIFFLFTSTYNVLYIYLRLVPVHQLFFLFNRGHWRGGYRCLELVLWLIAVYILSQIFVLQRALTSVCRRKTLRGFSVV